MGVSVPGWGVLCVQQPVDSAPSQPAPGGLFGQAAQSFDSTTATPFTFSAPSAVGFGAAPDQGSFNIG